MRWVGLRLGVAPNRGATFTHGHGSTLSTLTTRWTVLWKNARHRHLDASFTPSQRKRGSRGSRGSRYKWLHMVATNSWTAFGDPLIEFVRRSGGLVGTGVTVGESGSLGCGLFASQPCETGTILISLPPKAQLSYDAKSTDKRLLCLIDKVPEELWGGKLALSLLYHRANCTQHFADYISALPSTFTGLPIFFSDEAVRAIEYPPTTAEVIRRCRWLLNFTGQEITPLQQQKLKDSNGQHESDPFSGVVIDANTLGWGLGAVTSRAFRPRGTQNPACMLPLIDMANHSFDANCKIVMSRGGELSMIAARDIGAGEQLCIDYGPWPNDYFFLDYGFVIPNNPHDTVLLKFDRSLIEAAKEISNVPCKIREDGSLPSLPSWQKKALESLGISSLNGSPSGCQVAIRQQHGKLGTCPVEEELLGGVRILCATSSSELKDATASRLCDWSRPLTQANELASLRTLLGICAIALSRFSTTDVMDTETLDITTSSNKEKAPLSKDVELAIRFRLEKKRLLARAMATLSSRIKELPNVIEQGKHLGSSEPHKGFGRRST